METEDRFFSLEYFLTILFLLPLLFFFPQETHALQSYLFIGIIAAVAVSYFSLGRYLAFRKVATLVVSFFILGWTVYAISQSTFSYREVLVICIKSLSFLIIANSFSAFLEGYLSSMQIFNILLFFCICALTREYNKYFLILIAGFVFNLSILVRIKLGLLFRHSDRSRIHRQSVSLLLIMVLLLAAFAAWVLFLNVPMREIRTWGYLKDEDLAATQGQESQEKAQSTAVPDEQIQKELTGLTLKLSSTDEMYKVLASIQDLLVKESVYASEVGNAENNILKMVDNLSATKPGAAGAGDLKASVKAYVDRKIAKNLAQIKQDIGKVIQDNHIGLLQKLPVLSSVNKIEYSSSLAGIDKYSQQLKAALNNKSISTEAKKQLSQLSRQLKEWKSYQLYRNKLNSLGNKINSLKGELRNNLDDLVRQISDMNKSSESGSIDKNMDKLRAGLPAEKAKLVDDAEETFNLKKEMLAFKENSQLRQKLEKSGQALDRTGNFEEILNAIEESKDRQEAAKKIGQLLESMGEGDSSQVPQEVKDALKAKLESLVKESSDAIKKQIKENNLGEDGKNLLDDLRKMTSESNKTKQASAAAKIQKSIDTFYKQKDISKDTKDNLIKDSKTIEQLLSMKSELAQMQKQQESQDKSGSLDYIKKASDLLQSSSLENEQKELMDKLMEKLANAQTVNQVEDVLSAISQEASTSGKKENSKDVEKIKELMQKAAQAKKDLLQSSSLENEQKELMDKLMEKLANAQTVNQVEDVLSAISQEASTSGKKENSKDVEKIKELMQKAAQAKKDLLQSSSLENEQKELMDKLMEKLANAQTVNQVEDVLSAISQEASTSGKKENSKDVEKIKELMDKAAQVKKMFILAQASSGLSKKIEALKSESPQQAAALEKNLNQIRESKTKENLTEKIKALNESLESKQSESKTADTSGQGGSGSLKIYLLPNYGILPLNSTISLTSLAINNNFIKEVEPELEWLSSNPSVAFVNQHGLVSARGLGQAEITSRYRGVVSKKCKITVVEAIPDIQADRLKNELRE